MVVKINDYHITKKIYSGVRNTVYKAIREYDSKPVVIKVINSKFPSFEEIVKFRNQYTISLNINIDGIVKPLSLEAFNNSYALVMEDYGGISLNEYLAQECLDIPDFLQIAIQLSTIIDKLIRQRVIHKDIKPANILINPENKQVKLIDFSIASLLPRETQQLQNPNILEGTLAYISPEQTGRMNRGIDYRTDFYSLGITFFELLTGKLPFSSNQPIELVHCHLAKQAQEVHKINSNIPLVISNIVSKLMAKNAEDRYQSALGLKYDLEKCLQQYHSGCIEAFKIAERDINELFIIPEKLYGRETEVKSIISAFERISKSSEFTLLINDLEKETYSIQSQNKNGKSELFLVAGFSGVGKTAIVNQVHKPIVKQRGYFIKGKFDQFQRDIPFSAIVQALRDLIEQLLSDSKIKLEEWKSKILQPLGENAQVIIDVIPELEKIIGKQPSVLELSGSTAQNRFYLLFQNFIQVFAAPEHPLVIFLDDLQWADSASLKLMQLLMTETESNHLLIIGAYRDNQVSPTHPLMLTLDKISSLGSIVNTINLLPLQQKDLNNLIADTLNCSELLAKPFSQLIYQKTKGNPFFATQLLKSLYKDNLIKFNPEIGYWECDIAQIKASLITDNVVDFMAKELQDLPKATQEILKLSACIGNKFDLETLAIVQEQTLAKVAMDLWKALQEGLIIPINETYKFFLDESATNEFEETNITVEYKFLHDRVQQAAYSLISQEKQEITHLKIGRLLLNSIPENERFGRIFEIVNQLNIGVELIEEQAERYQLAHLNLIAANKAKVSTAYTAAATYLNTAIKLLTSDSWNSEYELTLEIYSLATEVAYLNGDFQQMQQFSSVVLQNVSNILDKVKIFEINILADMAQNQPVKAIETGILGLKFLGVNVSKKPRKLEVWWNRLWINISLLGREIEDLIQLPKMSNAYKQKAMPLLATVGSAAYLTSPNLLLTLMFKQVTLSLKYGNSIESIYTYACYGLILCEFLGDVDSGYRFGQLSLSLLDKLNVKQVKPRTYQLIYSSIKPWKEHLKNTLEPLLEAYQSGLETGDIEYAAKSAQTYCSHSYLVGKQLQEVLKDMNIYTDAIAQLKQTVSLNKHRIYHQVIINLTSNLENPCRLIGEAYNEQTENSNVLSTLFFNKTILCYLFEDYSQAIDNATLTEKYLTGGLAGGVIAPLFYFYDSLCQLAIYPETSDDKQENILNKVLSNQSKMKKWVKFSPMNHQHKYDLVKAELYRVTNKPLEAIELYESAIAGAKKNEYIQEEALANELAAKFYINWDKNKIAQAYIIDAYYCYIRWGATAKVQDIEKRYGQLLEQVIQQENLAYKQNNIADISRATVTYSSAETTKLLNWETIIKSSQTLAKEIDLYKLILNLMQVVIENAGATKAALILPKEDSWVVEALVTNIDVDDISLANALIKESLSLNTCKELPLSVVNYVANTQKYFLNNNVAKQQFHLNDDYITKHQPKSLFCIPIEHQSKLIGILYLENNLTINAFTSQQQEVLKMLSVSAAISLENALLYANLSTTTENLKQANLKLEEYSQSLEQKVDAKTKKLSETNQELIESLQKLKQTQAQLIQSEKMSSLGQMVAGVAHEINNPIGFIYGNLTHAKQYVEDLLHLVNVYQECYPQPVKEVEEEIENMEIEFLTEDLEKIFNSCQDGAERIRKIVLSLRNFSRLDESEMKPVDINEGIDSTLLFLQNRLQKTTSQPNIEVIKEYAQLPKVNCYASDLNQAFMNIINNAIDAVRIAHSEITPIINISTKLTNRNTIIISIADNGIGISEETQSKIFDPFFTTKPVGSGMGLGLYTSYSTIVEKYHGSLNCKSVIERGSEFLIEIPINYSK